MTNRYWLCSLLSIAACPARTAPPPAPPPVYVEYEMHAEVADSPASTTDAPATTPVRPVSKDQPPHIKLKLGHYRNARLNIGVTIDLTEATENVADLDPAKLRFDGDDKIWRLEGRHGGNGRIDYVRERGRVMLQMTRDGRVTVYVPDPETDRSTEVDVYRDADADPL